MKMSDTKEPVYSTQYNGGGFYAPQTIGAPTRSSIEHDTPSPKQLPLEPRSFIKSAHLESWLSYIRAQGTDLPHCALIAAAVPCKNPRYEDTVKGMLYMSMLGIFPELAEQLKTGLIPVRQGKDNAMRVRDLSAAIAIVVALRRRSTHHPSSTGSVVSSTTSGSISMVQSPQLSPTGMINPLVLPKPLLSIHQDAIGPQFTHYDPSGHEHLLLSGGVSMGGGGGSAGMSPLSAPSAPASGTSSPLIPSSHALFNNYHPQFVPSLHTQDSYLLAEASSPYLHHTSYAQQDMDAAGVEDTPFPLSLTSAGNAWWDDHVFPFSVTF